MIFQFRWKFLKPSMYYFWLLAHEIHSQALNRGPFSYVWLLVKSHSEPLLNPSELSWSSYIQLMYLCWNKHNFPYKKPYSADQNRTVFEQRDLCPKNENWFLKKNTPRLVCFFRLYNSNPCATATDEPQLRKSANDLSATSCFIDIYERLANVSHHNLQFWSQLAEIIATYHRAILQ